MTNKNTIIISILLLIFAFAVSTLAFPWFGREGMQLGLDLQGVVRCEPYIPSRRNVLTDLEVAIAKQDLAGPAGIEKAERS